MQRRAQRPITIRSDRAAAKLDLLTRTTGRSQARLIEEALDLMPVPEETDRAAKLARIDATLALLHQRTDIPSMAEFDAREYDERGNPR